MNTPTYTHFLISCRLPRDSYTMIHVLILILMIPQAVEGTTFGSGSLKLYCKGEIQSCKGRCSKSFVNHIEYNGETPCSCDPQCRYVFGDCCADYETYCARPSLPKDTTHYLFKWECRNIFKEPTIANIKLHMVDSCMQGWPNDQTSINCSTPKIIS